MTTMILTDARRSKIEPHRLDDTSDPGRTGDGRLFLEAVLSIARTGAARRDPPEAFGDRNTIFKRLRRWVKLDGFKRIFDVASGDPDVEFAMIDGTIVKVHRHGQGSKGGLEAGPPKPRRPGYALASSASSSHWRAVRASLDHPQPPQRHAARHTAAINTI